VSLLSRDRLLVSLSPAAVAWVRLHGTFRPQVVAKGSVDADPAFGRESWAGALSALHAAAPAWQRERVAVTVVLSNQFARYALLERQGRGVSRDEEAALASFHFKRLHGERAAGWDVRVTATGRAGAKVASAVDRTLLDGIKAAFPRENRPRLKSIQPYLMSAFNRLRAKLDKRGGWLVLVEPGQVCIALLAGKAWSAVQSVRSQPDAAENWLELLERERQRAPVHPVPTTVLARTDVAPDAAGGASRDWHLVMLEAPFIVGVEPGERESYAMALHAA
jgi:hypothetical protein